MTRTVHDEARELLALGRAEDLSEPQQTWLRDHLQQCADCTQFHKNLVAIRTALQEGGAHG